GSCLLCCGTRHSPANTPNTLSISERSYQAKVVWGRGGSEVSQAWVCRGGLDGPFVSVRIKPLDARYFVHPRCFSENGCRWCCGGSCQQQALPCLFFADLRLCRQRCKRHKGYLG
ncbi:unnamed protein product, partial [Scytosiphon promiscuus]